MSSQVSLAGLCPKSLVKALIGKEFSLIRVGCRVAWGECGDRVKSQTKPRLCSKEEAGGHGCWDSAHHCSRGVLHPLPRPSLHSLERLVSYLVCSSLLPTPMLVSYPDVFIVSNNCLPFPQRQTIIVVMYFPRTDSSLGWSFSSFFQVTQKLSDEVMANFCSLASNFALWGI